MWASTYQSFITYIKLSAFIFIQKHLLNADNMSDMSSTVNQFSEVGTSIFTWRPKELCNLSKFRPPLPYTEDLF